MIKKPKAWERVKIARMIDVKEYLKLHNQICTLKEIALEYPGKTIENIIAQMEARKLTIMSQNNKTQMRYWRP